MKQFFKYLYSIRKQPRGRALIEIGLYVILFLILFALLNHGSSSSPTLTPEEQYANLKEYTYHMKMNMGEVTYDVIGNKTENSEIITINDNTYQVVDGNMIDETGETIFDFDFDWNLYSPQQLSIFISQGIVNFTTQYKDESIMTEYEMECSIWNETINGICQLQVATQAERITQVKLQMLESSDSITIVYEI